MEANQWRCLDEGAKRHFLAELRQARLTAQRDAEAFDQLLFVLERLGCYRLRRAGTLGKYKDALLELARESGLARSIAVRHPAWHSEASVLYKLVNQARNDTLHQGARARHLTEHTVELALIFEDALMNGNEPMATLGDIMVRSPATAEAWHPVSHVRQVMLTNSFSTLPILWEGRWKVVTDAQVAAFLRRGSSNGERNRLLGLTLSEAASEGLGFDCAPTKQPGFRLADLGTEPLEKPLLIIEETPKGDGATNERLLGIVTAFDILCGSKREVSMAEGWRLR